MNPIEVIGFISETIYRDIFLSYINIIIAILLKAGFIFDLLYSFPEINL